MIRVPARVSRLGITVASAFVLIAGLTPTAFPTAAAAASDGSSPTVDTSVQNDVSPPLRTLNGDKQRKDENKKGKHETRRHPHAGSQLPGGHVTTPGSGTSGTSMPATSNSFDGVGQGFSGPQGTFTVNAAPPDPNGAVGPNHYVETVNTDYAVFSKTGIALYGPVPINTIWQGFGGRCEADNDGDPTVVYDRLADRWVISQFAITGATGSSSRPFLECVAVSTSPDPAGTFYRYAFPYSSFPDYPKLGVWPNAYVLSANRFNSSGTSFLGPMAVALNRSKMLAGQAANQVVFNLSSTYGSLLPADLDGPTAPPAGSPAYFAALGPSSLYFWRLTANWTTPSSSTLSTPSSVAIAPYAQACNGGACIPQAGTSQQLDSLGDRLMYRLAYRNFGDHESLVVNHSVNVNSTVGIRWYEIRSPSSPAIYQSGTYSPDGNYRWMGSIAMDHVGNVALGFSESSSSLNPAVRYTGRLANATSALGTLSDEASIKEGSGSQLTNLNRWGDYTSLAVDPSDDCTFWYTNEYLASDGTFNWHTRVSSFKYPNCALAPSDFSISASPSSLSGAQGGSGQSTISTGVTSGSAQAVSFAATGQPAGTTVSFNPASVTAGGSTTMTVNVGESTTPGSYTITVTGTEGSTTHTTTVGLTVTASDFSISANPTSLSLGQGGAGSSTVSTVVAAGSAPVSVSLTASGQPAGTTVSFSPASVNSGGSSTMTVNVGASDPTGDYTITITGTGANGAVHTATVALTVTAPQPSDFSIGANPSSVTVAQGANGTATISTALTSGSSQSVSLSSDAPSGVSVSFNPASVITGNSSTMTMAATATAAPGTYTITVTGTAASGSHTAQVSLTVAASDFTIGATPSSLSLAQGANGTSNISTTVSSGAAQNVTFGASGQPPGTTVTFNPASVTSGQSSTMTVAVGAGTATGSYTIAVNGTGPSAVHGVNVAVTVTAGQVVTNGTFDSGNLNGWTATTGNAASPKIVSTNHSAPYAAQLGSTAAYNGNSTLQQTVTIPAGSSRLTFWYQPHCPDTLTYDQQQAQIRNTSGGTLATVLNVCSNSGAWTSVSFDTSAYAGQTVVLWFNDHDDGYASDPTYFFLDDVAINAYTAPPPPPPSANVVQNPGFESGSLSSWSASGAYAPLISTQTPHSASYDAQVGSKSPFNGDSILTQTVNVPTGSPTLTFWYQPHCTDTITYDQIKMEIKNSSGTVLATVLNVCSNSGAWTQVSYNMATYAGQQVVLSFKVHDDNYPSDPTYTLVDDVSLS